MSSVIKKKGQFLHPDAASQGGDFSYEVFKVKIRLYTATINKKTTVGKCLIYLKNFLQGPARACSEDN